MRSARPVGRVFSPLDKELALLPSTFSPFIHQCIVRLGTLLPFEQAAEQIAAVTGVPVGRETVRRLTEQAGTAQVTIETDDLRRVPHTACPEPAVGLIQQLSADGAMVPLTGGTWAEVRTLAIGVVGQQMGPNGPEVHAHDVSYFSRLCRADDFIDWATLPFQQRGTERAETVVAVMDGAPWLQELIAAHRPDAVRILDFPHAAGYLSQAAQAAFGAGSREAAVWLDTWLPTLKRGTPEEVLEAIRALPAPTPEARQTRASVLGYLRHRLPLIRYADFQRAGYPLGSGMVESGNKLVVEVRMKGAGMHWARTNVTPMLALRGILCSGRWDAAWLGIWQELGRQTAERRRQGRLRRQAARVEREAQAVADETLPSTPKRLPPEPKRVVAGRPTEQHRWKRGYDQRSLARARARAKS
jgi:hypothetical protein